MLQKNIYYARHIHDWKAKFLGDDSMVEFLYENNLIGIHYDSIESWDPDKYSRNGKSPIRHLNYCNENPDSTYIFSSYKINGDIKVLAGKPKINSKCFLKDFINKNHAEPIKILQLDSVVEIEKTDFPFAFLFPPKLCTFVRWHQCEVIANKFIDKSKLLLNEPTSYMPDALEILCEEYLRNSGALKGLIFKSGGQMREHDIVGLNHQNKKVYAQVKNVAKKWSLKSYKNIAEADGDSVFYFFSNIDDKYLDEKPANLKVVTITHVIRYMIESADFGESYLENLSLRF